MKKYKIKEYIDKHGITERSIGKKLGVSDQYINAVVKERIYISHERLVQIAKILGVKWTELVTKEYLNDLKKKLGVKDLVAI